MGPGSAADSESQKSERWFWLLQREATDAIHPHGRVSLPLSAREDSSRVGEQILHVMASSWEPGQGLVQIG